MGTPARSSAFDAAWQAFLAVDARLEGIHGRHRAAAAGGHSGVDELARVPLDLLERGKYQPRLDMREESLAELAGSIRAQGVVQPIVVRPTGTPAPGGSLTSPAALPRWHARAAPTRGS